MATIPTIAYVQLVTNTWLTDVATEINELNALLRSGTPLDSLAAAAELGAPYIHLREQQTASTAGGTFTSGAYRTRTLTTEVSDTESLCTLATNQFTLDAGDYLIRASAPAYGVDNHRTQLYNATGAASLLYGTAEINTAASLVQTRSYVIGLFTIAASQALELRHRCQTTRATDGFGVASIWGVEVYSIVELWRVG